MAFTSGRTCVKQIIKKVLVDEHGFDFAVDVHSLSAAQRNLLADFAKQVGYKYKGGGSLSTASGFYETLKNRY